MYEMRRGESLIVCGTRLHIYSKAIDLTSLVCVCVCVFVCVCVCVRERERELYCYIHVSHKCKNIAHTRRQRLSHTHGQHLPYPPAPNTHIQKKMFYVIHKCNNIAHTHTHTRGCPSSSQSSVTALWTIRKMRFSRATSERKVNCA